MIDKAKLTEPEGKDAAEVVSKKLEKAAKKGLGDARKFQQCSYHLLSRNYTGC
jgi:hypothetical protein